MYNIKKKKMGYKLKKDVAGSTSFRYNVNGSLTKYITAEITQKQLSELASAGAEFVIEDKSTKKTKKKSNDENKTDNSDID